MNHEDTTKGQIQPHAQIIRHIRPGPPVVTVFTTRQTLQTM